MKIQGGPIGAGLNADGFARRVLWVILVAPLIILITGCEITDSDWRGRDNIKTLQPTSPPPPKQWEWDW
jgi:hypothetical protein